MKITGSLVGLVITTWMMGQFADRQPYIAFLSTQGLSFVVVKDWSFCFPFGVKISGAACHQGATGVVWLDGSFVWAGEVWRGG
jgi:hypothetical protein